MPRRVEPRVDDRGRLTTTSLDYVARERIKQWMTATRTTQVSLANSINRKQAWMSRYLGGEYDADLETLRKIAAVFGRQISALFDTPSDPEIAELVSHYNALPASGRGLVLDLVRELAGESARRSKQSSDGSAR